MQRDGIHHCTFVSYRKKVTFISKETHQPSLSFKIDANYSVYSFNGDNCPEFDKFCYLIQILSVKNKSYLNIIIPNMKI